MVVLAAFGLLSYLGYEKLTYLKSNPKTVNLDVTYTDSLDFPAVTICNTNQYKWVYVL